MKRVLDQLVRRLMQRALRRAFRRVVWVGPLPTLPSGRPLVLYANHHSFYDGYLLWLVADRLFGRPCTLWMADWERYPLFAASGAQPFPPDDPAARAATLRRTARRFRERPDTVLIYFPEGRLHPPDEGVLPFDEALVARLGRLFPDALWWPVALHVTWWNEAHPTVLMAGGTPHATPPHDTRSRLAALLEGLRSAPPEATHVLLEGRRGPNESHDLRLLSPLFRRFL